VPIPAGGLGLTGTAFRDGVGTGERQLGIEQQQPVTEQRGTSTVAGRAQVGIALSNGCLHTGGLDIARCPGGRGIVRLIPRYASGGGD
jgi:hypothetical protein